MLDWEIIISISVKCNTQLNLQVFKTLKEWYLKGVLNIARELSSVLNYTHASL